MDNRWFNVACYIVGSACAALGLVDTTALAPYGKALASFGAALLALGRWDKILAASLRRSRTDLR